MNKWIQKIRKGLSICLDGDRLLYAGLLVIVALIVFCALAFPVENPSGVKSVEQVADPAGCWNTQRMEPAEGTVRAEAERIFTIEQVYDSEEEFPKGLKIDQAGIQGIRVLVVFERYRDLNPSMDRDYMAVYDVDGHWLYGIEGVLAGGFDGKEIALRPDEEGILIWKWRLNEADKALFLLIAPDGEKKAFAAERIWSDTPAYWDSPYTVIHTKESKLVIADRETGAQTTVFDYSDVYPQMYPKSSEIDEEDEWMYNALIPIFFFIVMILVLPKLMDNPDMQRKGVREKHGDLRDRM